MYQVSGGNALNLIVAYSLVVFNLHNLLIPKVLDEYSQKSFDLRVLHSIEI